MRVSVSDFQRARVYFQERCFGYNNNMETYFYKIDVEKGYLAGWLMIFVPVELVFRP